MSAGGLPWVCDTDHWALLLKGAIPRAFAYAEVHRCLKAGMHDFPSVFSEDCRIAFVLRTCLAPKEVINTVMAAHTHTAPT
eukprot:1156564-Pelagomonas_calceolata.AAC.6